MLVGGQLNEHSRLGLGTGHLLLTPVFMPIPIYLASIKAVWQVYM